jgi:hypothetical protein
MPLDLLSTSCHTNWGQECNKSGTSLNALSHVPFIQQIATKMIRRALKYRYRCVSNGYCFRWGFLPFYLAIISRSCAPSPQSTLSHNGIPPTKTRPRSAQGSQELLSLSISMDTASLDCLAYSLAVVSRSVESETITPFLQQVVIIDKEMWRTPKNHYPWLSQWILLL